MEKFTVLALMEKLQKQEERMSEIGDRVKLIIYSEAYRKRGLQMKFAEPQ